MPAETIGNRYIISKKIGEGGMADVYLAVDVILKRQVAIKVLRGELNNDPVNLKRFQKEANAITSLSHPNIVEVYDVGEENNRNYIVMEYVPGKTLKQLIKARGALYPDEAINIMKQLVSATAHAHKNNIIHRDIKSQNVLVKDDGSVKLSDFGIAFTGDSQQLTQTDTVMGSVHYLAPELAKGQQATVQSDIYSLGVVFYEMLTGDVPFHGDTPVQIAIKHMHDPIPSVRAFNPDLPQSVENIVIRSTAKDKNDRYKSADEMYNDLVTCLDFSRIKEQKLVLESVKQKQEKAAAAKPAAQPVKVKKIKRRKGGSIGMGIFASLSAILLAGSIIYIIMLLNGQLSPSNVTKIKVPNVTGHTIEDATTMLESAGLTVSSIERQATDDVEKDIVLDTSPRGGTEVESSTTVVLYVSSGKVFKVGNYVGKSINSVKSTLENNGFEVLVSEVLDGTKDDGTITSQSLASGTVIDPLEPRKIEFTVARQASFTIPQYLLGMDVEAAKLQLENMGATVKLKQLPAEENLNEDGTFKVQPNTVVAVSPDVGKPYTQKKGKSITLKYY